MRNYATRRLDLVVAIDHDDRARAIGGLEVLDALVVAEEVDALARKVGLQREVKLARRDDVETEAFLRDDAKELRGGKRFGRVEDLSRAVHRRHVLRGALAHGRLVVHVKRRAMAASQLDEVTTAHLHVA